MLSYLVLLYATGNWIFMPVPELESQRKFMLIRKMEWYFKHLGISINTEFAGF